MRWGKGLMRRGIVAMLEWMAGMCVRLALFFGFCASQLKSDTPPPETSRDSESSR